MRVRQSTDDVKTFIPDAAITSWLGSSKRKRYIDSVKPSKVKVHGLAVPQLAIERPEEVGHVAGHRADPLFYLTYRISQTPEASDSDME